MAHLMALMARLTLGIMWILAASGKLTSSEPRERAIEEFGVLRGRSAHIAGLVLPLVELALGIALVIGEGTLVAGGISALLLMGFSAAMASVLVQGKKVRCNCFGQFGSADVTWGSLARNGGLLALAVITVVARSDYLALHRLTEGSFLRPGEPSLTELPPLLLIWMAGGLGLALLTSTWGTLVTMARADGGPADDLPETDRIRRLLRIDRTVTSLASLEGQ